MQLEAENCNNHTADGDDTLVEDDDENNNNNTLVDDDNTTLVDDDNTTLVDDDDNTTLIDDDDLYVNYTICLCNGTNYTLDYENNNTLIPTDGENGTLPDNSTLWNGTFVDINGTLVYVDDDDWNNTLCTCRNVTLFDEDPGSSNDTLPDDGNNNNNNTLIDDDDYDDYDENGNSTLQPGGNETLSDGGDNTTLGGDNETLADDGDGGNNSTLCICNNTLPGSNNTAPIGGNGTMPMPIPIPIPINGTDGNSTYGNFTFRYLLEGNSTDDDDVIDDNSTYYYFDDDNNTTLCVCNETLVDDGNNTDNNNTLIDDGNNSTLEDGGNNTDNNNNTLIDDGNNNTTFPDECNTTLLDDDDTTDEVLDDDDYIEPPSRPTCTGDYLASATYCSTDQYDRPVAGMLHICITPDFFDEKRLELNLVTAVHELGHILGFNSQSLAHFRDKTTGAPLTRRDSNGDVPDVEVECTGISSDRKTSTVPLPSESILQFQNVRSGVRTAQIVTPTVRQVARNHFDCQTLKGAELESDSHTADICISDHWERRLFQGDIMNPIMDDVKFSSPISPLTAAYFVDSGWYEVDVSSVANPVAWGRSAGCDFVKKTCLTRSSQVSSKNSPFFCTSSAGPQGCSTDRMKKARCSTGEYEEALPPEFRHFASRPSFGGRDPYSDYCPLWDGYEGGFCKVKESADGSRVSRMEEFGIVNSRCVSGQLDGEQEALCIPVACVMDERKLKIRVDGFWKTCEFAGQHIPRWWEEQDYVVCPDPHQMCPSFFCSKNCLTSSNVGVCDSESGECLCAPDPSSDDLDDFYNPNEKASNCEEEEKNEDFEMIGGDLRSDYYFSNSQQLVDDEKDILDHTVRMFTTMSVGEVIGFVACSLVAVVVSIIVVSYIYRVFQSSRGGTLVPQSFKQFISRHLRNREWIFRPMQEGIAGATGSSTRNKQKMAAAMLVNLRMQNAEIEENQARRQQDPTAQKQLDPSSDSTNDRPPSSTTNTPQAYTSPLFVQTNERNILRSELPHLPNHGRVLAIIGANYVDDHLVPIEGQEHHHNVANTIVTDSEETSTHFNLENVSIESTNESDGSVICTEDGCGEGDCGDTSKDSDIFVDDREMSGPRHRRRFFTPKRW